MGSKRNSLSWVGTAATAAALALLSSSAFLAAMSPAVARDKAKAPENLSFFDTIGRWFDQQADNFSSTVGGARSTVEEFGHEAGMAAGRTVNGAKSAADAVASLPAARVVSGYEKCRIAPNGAPDCIAAADAVCRAKGFKSGSSVDMTTAEVCQPKVYLAGRNSGPGCHTETFVSRAFCQ